jgi:hypothetical protein
MIDSFDTPYTEKMWWSGTGLLITKPRKKHRNGVKKRILAS